MPIESIDYDILTEEWKEISTQLYKENNLFNSCNSKGTHFFHFVSEGRSVYKC